MLFSQGRGRERDEGGGISSPHNCQIFDDASISRNVVRGGGELLPILPNAREPRSFFACEMTTAAEERKTAGEKGREEGEGRGRGPCGLDERRGHGLVEGAQEVLAGEQLVDGGIDLGIQLAQVLQRGNGHVQEQRSGARRR